MKKIPTLFMRDPQDMKQVLRKVHPECAWVIEGEGTATRKYDGTCVMYDGVFWWARREVKADRRPPRDFQPVELDPLTGKQVGWEPIEQSAFAKFHAEALVNCPDDAVAPLPHGTYELIGPKINDNHEQVPDHLLISHNRAKELADVPRDFDGLRLYLLDPQFVHEGIVWHHPDGRMAKLKKRDFPRT